MRSVKVDRERTLTFAQDQYPTYIPQGVYMNFYVDGVQFAARGGRHPGPQARTPCEEWKLVNQSREFHSMHIHINPFQVVAIGDVPVEQLWMQDNGHATAVLVHHDPDSSSSTSPGSSCCTATSCSTKTSA